MLFSETGERSRRTGKRKLIKYSRNYANCCKTPLKYVYKHVTRGQRSRMVSVVAKAALLVHFLHMIVEVVGQSPCPNYFRYIREELSEEIVGYIEIPWPPKGVPLQLSVSMSVAVALPTKYVGRLELAQSKEESVKVIQQGRPLKYKIHFPLRRPIPYLTRLLFNNQEICSGPRATGPIVTSIVLNHTLYPPAALPPLDNGNVLSNWPDFYVTSKPAPTKPPIFEPATPKLPVFEPNTPKTPVFESVTPKTPVLKPGPQTNTINENDENCGKGNEINLLISNGEATYPGQWPWLVAIFIDDNSLQFECAGTLLTQTHILTAAHCFRIKHGSLKEQHNPDLPVGTIVVSVGRYRLREFRESGSENREVAYYTIHPHYSRQRLFSGYDLAIVVMRKSVEYSDRIKPICLWTGPTDLKSIVGQTGYVVGWGRDEFGNRYVDEPRMVIEPIVSQEVCLRSHKIFREIISNRTFCAGSRSGSGPCNGDSGSGFVIYNQATRRYYLRGVVSSSLKEGDPKICVVKEYVVYADVAKNLDWIREQISR